MITIKTKNEVGEIVAVKATGGELAALIKAITKDKGDGVVYTGNNIPPVERLLSGCFEFDLATGGGWPKGRLSQVYGPESSGKSNICYKTIASVQKLPAPNNKVVLIDMEGTFDPKWAALFGIDLEALIVVKPGYGEEAVDLIIALVHADDLALLVVDSIAMLTSAKEVEQSAEKFDVGTAPMLIKRLCNKLALAFAAEQKRDHAPTVIFVNQTRFKIGVMFGDPETFPGGQALRFLLSLNVRLYGKNKIIKEIHPDLPVFKETNAVIKKAKIGVSMVAFTYDMCVYPIGKLMPGSTDSFKTVSDHLKVTGVIQPIKGGWEYKGHIYPTLAAMKDAYMDGGDIQLKMQADVIQQVTSKQFFVEAEDKP